MRTGATQQLAYPWSMSYYGLVLRRAARDTSFFGITKIVSSLVVSVLALVLQWKIGIRSLPVTLQIIATIVTAYILVALAAFIANLIATPVRLHREQAARIEELEGRVSGLEDQGARSRRSLTPVLKRLSTAARKLPVPIQLGAILYSSSPWGVTESDLHVIEQRAPDIVGADLDAASTALSALRSINALVVDIKREEDSRRGWNPNQLRADVWAKYVEDAQRCLEKLAASIGEANL